MDYPNPQNFFYGYQLIDAIYPVSSAGFGGSGSSSSAPATGPISLSQLQAGTLPPGVILPLSQLQPGTLPPGVTVPASALPPRTNSLSIVSGKLRSTVDGAVSEIALSALVNCAAITAAYPTTVSAASATANLLTDACTKLAIKSGVSAFGASLDYYVLAA